MSNLFLHNLHKVMHTKVTNYQPICSHFVFIFTIINPSFFDAISHSNLHNIIAQKK